MERIDLGAEMSRTLSQLEKNDPELALSLRIRQAWSSAISSKVQKHVDGVFVVPHTNGEEFIVYVDSPLRATEMTMQSELYRISLNTELARMSLGAERTKESIAGSKDIVKKIKFVPSKEQYRGRTHNLASSDDMSAGSGKYQADPIPLDAQELKELDEIVAPVNDPDLRRAIYDAAKASLELGKGIDRAESGK